MANNETKQKVAKAAGTDFEELETLTAPLVQWLRRNYDPHTEVSITWDQVQVKESRTSIPFPYDD